MGNCVFSQKRIFPVGGLKIFQDSILKSNEAIKKQFEASGLIIVGFYVKLDKTGKVKRTKFIDSCGATPSTILTLENCLKGAMFTNSEKQKDWLKFVYWFRNTEDTIKVKLAEPDSASRHFIFDKNTKEFRFLGGDKELTKYFTTNVSYPRKCIKRGDEGIVTLETLIQKDGSVKIINIASSNKNCPEFIEESKRVMSASEPFVPSFINGKRVTAFATFPIQFNVFTLSR